MTLRQIHPGFAQFGALTGRLAGSGGFSVHQQPKAEQYLRSWRARPGYLWISLDFKSVEDVILTEMSRDPNLLKLYGPDAHPAQDAYLFTAAGLPIVGPKLRAEGYDPDRPTAESVAHVKKVCKKERAIGKKLKLSANYGAGPNKIRQELELEGVKLSLSEAEKLHRGYWELYKGVKELEQDLIMEWERNNGWVLNGVGRPVGCHVDKLKDLISRCLAEGTLVRVKNRGWVEIQDIQKSDEVWDGDNWVQTDGVVFNGTREVIELNGIWLTHDHQMMTMNGWRKAEDVEQIGINSLKSITSPRASWKEVWSMGNYIISKVSEKLKNLCRGKVSSHYSFSITR